MIRILTLAFYLLSSQYGENVNQLEISSPQLIKRYKVNAIVISYHEPPFHFITIELKYLM